MQPTELQLLQQIGLSEEEQLKLALELSMQGMLISVHTNGWKNVTVISAVCFTCWAHMLHAWLVLRFDLTVPECWCIGPYHVLYDYAFLFMCHYSYRCNELSRKIWTPQKRSPRSLYFKIFGPPGTYISAQVLKYMDPLWNFCSPRTLRFAALFLVLR